MIFHMSIFFATLTKIEVWYEKCNLARRRRIFWYIFCHKKIFPYDFRTFGTAFCQMLVDFLKKSEFHMSSFSFLRIYMCISAHIYVQKKTLDSTSRDSESKSYQSVNRILSLQFVTAVKGEINEKCQRKGSVSNIPNPLSFLKSARQVCPDYSQIWFQNRLKTGPKTRHVSPHKQGFWEYRKSKPAPKTVDWGVQIWK